MLCNCSEWQFDQPAPPRPTGFLRKAKGHKHDKLAAARYDAKYGDRGYTCAVLPGLKLVLWLAGRRRFRKTLMTCQQKYRNTGYAKTSVVLACLLCIWPQSPIDCTQHSVIFAPQDSRKLKEASLLDQLLLTPKQLRLKQYRETK